MVNISRLESLHDLLADISSAKKVNKQIHNQHNEDDKKDHSPGERGTSFRSAEVAFLVADIRLLEVPSTDAFKHVSAFKRTLNCVKNKEYAETSGIDHN